MRRLIMLTIVALGGVVVFSSPVLAQTEAPSGLEQEFEGRQLFGRFYGCLECHSINAVGSDESDVVELSEVGNKLSADDLTSWLTGSSTEACAIPPNVPETMVNALVAFLSAQKGERAAGSW